MSSLRPPLPWAPVVGGVGAAAVVAYTCLVGAGGPWGPADAFRWHPALACASVLVAMTLGVVTYALPVQMGGIGAVAPDRARRRWLHAGLQGAATLLLCASWLTAVLVRDAKGKSHWPWGKSTWIKAAHIGVGHALALLVVVAAAAGGVKLWHKLTDGAPVYRTHAAMGMAVWAGGMFCVASGCYFTFPLGTYPWTAVLSLVGTGVAAAATAAIYAGPRPLMMEHTTPSGAAALPNAPAAASAASKYTLVGGAHHETADEAARGPGGESDGEASGGAAAAPASLGGGAGPRPSSRVSNTSSSWH